MKKPAIILFAIGLSLVLISTVNAPWSTIGTGYAITSNFHGVNVSPGTPVTVTTGTLDALVTQVTFRWHYPDTTVAREVTIPVFTNGTTGDWNDGTTALVRYAMDTYAPTLLGDWGVQAFFQGSTGSTRAMLDNVVKTRATSFNVVPEIAFGTIGALAAMTVAICIFAVKKKRRQLQVCD